MGPGGAGELSECLARQLVKDSHLKDRHMLLWEVLDGRRDVLVRRGLHAAWDHGHVGAEHLRGLFGAVSRPVARGVRLEVLSIAARHAGVSSDSSTHGLLAGGEDDLED